MLASINGTPHPPTPHRAAETQTSSATGFLWPDGRIGKLAGTNTAAVTPTGTGRTGAMAERWHPCPLRPRSGARPRLEQAGTAMSDHLHYGIDDASEVERWTRSWQTSASDSSAVRMRCSVARVLQLR